MHLTGLSLFGKDLPKHGHYIDPLNFAEALITQRNTNIRSGFKEAALSRVLVYRGLPSNLHQPREYSRNLTQAANWERDLRVTVTHRPLKYIFKRNEQGVVMKDENGLEIYTGKQEKGIDVLCALAVVREVRISDLVILASQDTDLIPAIDEATNLNHGKVETCSWYSISYRSSREIRSEKNAIWNTRLNSGVFNSSRDQNIYL